jgi:hypothetical protein
MTELEKRFMERVPNLLNEIANAVKNMAANGSANQQPAVVPAPGMPLPNGVYVVYSDGSYKPYASGMDVTGITMIGIAHDGHYFGVPLDWKYGNQRLLKKDGYERDSHCVCEADMLLNWDFVGETEYLRGLGLAFTLKPGHYIPTGPVFLAMYANRNQLNAAMAAAGAEKIDFGESRWFAERYNVGNAWYFYGNYGYLTNFTVINGLQVGAVTLWEPKI